MADEYTPEMIAMLERQVAHFASDSHVVARAHDYRDASPAECWAATIALCRDLQWYLDRMDADTRARALAPEPLAPEVEAILVAMRNACR